MNFQIIVVSVELQIVDEQGFPGHCKCHVSCQQTSASAQSGCHTLSCDIYI